MTARGTPIPMPTLAPVERPELEDGGGVGVGGGGG